VIRTITVIALLAVAGIGGSAPVQADDAIQLRRPGRVYLDHVVPSPEGGSDVRLYLRVETLIGEPVDQLSSGDLTVRDGETLVDPGSLRIERLSAAGEGTSAVLVLDTSRTMSGEPFEQARGAALAFLERTGEFDHVALVAFDDDVGVLSDFGAPRNEARLALEQLEVQPKTLSKMVWDGANRAVEVLRTRPPALPRRGFVILFSDGRDSSSVHGLEEVIELASGGPGEGRIPVFTIGYSRFGGTGLEDLDRLAHGTGAASFQASAPDELGRFYDEIWKRMTGSFVVTYPGDMDGTRHTVQVTVGSRSESRAADYPDVSAPVWPWVVGGLLLAAAAGAAFVVLRLRGGGRLVVEGGSPGGREVPLRPGRLRIGALEENDLVLNLPTVSRCHAQVHVRGGKVELEDLGSKNGTFVNGVAIRTRAKLSPGDRLRFGDVDVLYRK